MTQPGIRVTHWTQASSRSVGFVVALLVALIFVPLVAGANTVDRLTTLYLYVILAAMWNALAGYGGLVSVGQQAFVGLGAYAAIKLAAYMSAYPALIIGGLLAGAVSLPISSIVLRLRGGEFAVGMWVVAAIAHLLVILDPTINGETGTSLLALSAFAAETRRAVNYWLSQGAMVVFLGLLFVLLRSRIGAAVQAIRDDEDAAASVGVRVLAIKRLIFVLAAFGCAIAGALWLATAITFQPRTYFGLQWTAYMIFMVIVGGLGRFEGPILGATLFFLVEEIFGAAGVWYLIVLGTTAILFALFAPRGIWGVIEDRYGLRLLPLGYVVSAIDIEGASPPSRTPVRETEGETISSAIKASAQTQLAGSEK